MVIVIYTTNQQRVFSKANKSSGLPDLSTSPTLFRVSTSLNIFDAARCADIKVHPHGTQETVRFAANITTNAENCPRFKLSHQLLFSCHLTYNAPTLVIY